MIGLPCVRVAPGDARALMDWIERQPATGIDLDIRTERLTAGDLSFTILLPAVAREALLSGHWDATALLVDRYDDVEAVAARLPYITGF